MFANISDNYNGSAADAIYATIEKNYDLPNINRFDVSLHNTPTPYLSTSDNTESLDHWILKYDMNLIII